ncbi:MAG: hypothetical protein WAU00_07265 [Caldilinea sp.]
MTLDLAFPASPYVILDPAVRGLSGDGAASAEKLPPLVTPLRRKVKEFRDSGYVGAADVRRSARGKKCGRATTSSRTSGNPSAPKRIALELTSVYHACPPGRRKLAVKVVDIFGNDTMTIVAVTV